MRLLFVKDSHKEGGIDVSVCLSEEVWIAESQRLGSRMICGAHAQKIIDLLSKDLKELVDQRKETDKCV